MCTICCTYLVLCKIVKNRFSLGSYISLNAVKIQLDFDIAVGKSIVEVLESIHNLKEKQNCISEVSSRKKDD